MLLMVVCLTTFFIIYNGQATKSQSERTSPSFLKPCSKDTPRRTSPVQPDNTTSKFKYSWKATIMVAYWDPSFPRLPKIQIHFPRLPLVVPISLPQMMMNRPVQESIL